MRRLRRGGAALAGLALLCSCATRQAIPVECMTDSVEIWVDQRLIDGTPDLLHLSTDEPHLVYIKAPGYQPQRYVFEPIPGPDGEPRLSPANLCVELVPRGQGRELQVEIDDPSDG